MLNSSDLFFKLPNQPIRIPYSNPTDFRVLNNNKLYSEPLWRSKLHFLSPSSRARTPPWRFAWRPTTGCTTWWPPQQRPWGSGWTWSSRERRDTHSSWTETHTVWTVSAGTLPPTDSVYRHFLLPLWRAQLVCYFLFSHFYFTTDCESQNSNHCDDQTV